MQCHLGGLQNDNIRGVGRTRVKRGGCTFSKSRFDIASGEEKGAFGWSGLELVIYSKALRSTIGVGVTSKWTSLLHFAHWLGLMSLVYFLFP
jgi:hypothetical protein